MLNGVFLIKKRILLNRYNYFGYKTNQGIQKIVAQLTEVLMGFALYC